MKKLIVGLKMTLVMASPLIIAALLYQYQPDLFTSYLLFAFGLLFILLVLWVLIRDDKQANGFSVPTISDYQTILEVEPLPAVPLGWSMRLIREMEWKKFEELCVAYFHLKGTNATLIPKGLNGYIELRLNKTTAVNAIVKHKTILKDVGVKEIKALLDLMAREKVSKGFYMAAGSFSAEAKTFAKENNVTLISGGMLLTMLKRLSVSQQEKLLTQATEGDYKAPTCPACNIKMISLHGPHQDKYYWGCVNKPKCRYIMPRHAQRKFPRKTKRNIGHA